MRPLTLALSTDVSKKRVWQALFDGTQRERWWAPGIVLEPKVGGVFRELGASEEPESVPEGAFGVIQTYYEPDMVSWTWQEESWGKAAMSEVTLALDGDQGHCRLQFTHRPLEGFSASDWESVRASYIEGWAELLVSLRNHLHGCDSPSDLDLVFEKRIEAPIEEVFSLWTSPVALAEWFCTKAQVQVGSGGLFEVSWEETGVEKSSTQGCHIIACNPPSLVSFQWRGPDHLPVMQLAGSTQVELSLKSRKAGTDLRLVHTGFGVSREWQEAKQWQKMAWNKALGALASHV